MTIDQITAAILTLSTDLACAADAEEADAIEMAIEKLRAARRNARGW